LDVWIAQDDANSSRNFIGFCATADVQEVGRFAAVKLQGVHSRHCQARAVYHTADIAVQLNVGQAGLASFDLGGFFFGQVAQVFGFLVAVEGVIVIDHLGVQGLPLAPVIQNQGVDFQDFGIVLHK